MWGSETELKLGHHRPEPSLVPVPQKWELLKVIFGGNGISFSKGYF
jgi:hypothetical protein